MNKKIICLVMFCLIYALDDCSGFELSTPFKLPTSAFTDKGKDSILNDKELSDSFKSPKSSYNNKEKDSILNDKELSDSFKSPKSDLNNQELSESFKMPGSQYNNLEYPNISQQNIIKANIVSDIVDYSFWINIYCQNINPIAGFQFELPNNLELLDIEGTRANDLGFQLHKNNDGLILGFSMSGDAIRPVVTNSKLESCSIVKLYVKADKESIFSFPIKTILAGPKGEKLSFKNTKDELLINDQAAIFSFYE